MIKRPSLNRRTFFKGLGSAALAYPLLNGLLQKVGQAQEGETSLRLFMMFTGNGQLPEHWLPTGSGTDMTLSPVLQALEPLKAKLLLARGMRGESGHAGGMSGALTGKPSLNGDGIATGGPSIDQFFASQWRGSTPLSSLELGVFPDNGPEDQTFYSASGLPVPVIGSPLGAFSKLTGLANLDPSEAAQVRAQKQSVLDIVSADITGLQSRLGQSSRTLLDQHLTLLREQEQLLLMPPPAVTCDFSTHVTDSPDIDKMWAAQHQVALTALRCGITRVVALRAGGWGGIESGHYEAIGVTDGHHNVAHGGGSQPAADLLKINQFHCQQLSTLAQGLEAIPEGDGTMLDHTVVVWVNEFGLGGLNDHSRDDVHVTLIGGSKAGLKNGTFFEMSGVDDQNFLVTLAEIAKPGVGSFGTRGNKILTEFLA
jgi:Protein of unknown function (DUF1552)